MPLPLVSMNGNVVDDPELRFTPGGHAVARFRVASSERVMDRQTNQWRDGDSCFLTVEVWRQQAENIAETVKKGMNVRVEGRLRQRSYDTKEGEKRTVYEVKGEDISVSLLRQTAAVTKNVGGGQSNGGAPAGGGQPTDAWSTPATAPAGAGFGGGSEPPF